MKKRVLLGLCVVFSVACGDDGMMITMDGGDGGEPDPAEAACSELAEPTMPIAAGEARDETAPEVTIGAEPYLVTIPASGTGYLRVVTDAPEELAIFFFRETSILTEVYDEGGAPLGAISAGPNPFCEPELMEHFDFDFETPGTYYVELTAAGDVWLLVSGGEGHLDV